MYDISSKIVSRLKGELSTAFVNVAESNVNAQEEDINNDNLTIIDSGIYEKMPTMESTSIPTHKTHQDHRPIFRRNPVKYHNDASHKISISSGYSVIKR